MKNTFRIIIMTAVLTMSAVAADAQILLGGGGLEPLDRKTVITDLSSPAGSGNLFVSISVDYPDGSDSTYYSSPLPMKLPVRLRASGFPN